MMRIQGYQLLLVALMGTMDCLTTVIGIVYFGTVELNPIMAGVANTNLSMFVILKLAATVLVCFTLVSAERILKEAKNKATKAFNYTHRLLKITNVGITTFLMVVVTNNLVILVNAL